VAGLHTVSTTISWAPELTTSGGLAYCGRHNPLGHLKATNSGGLAHCKHNNPLGHLKATTSGGLAHCEHDNRLGT
jgi:hypothetical protein